MAKHKKTSTQHLQACAAAAARRNGTTQWQNAQVAKFNARYTYSIAQGNVQRLHCNAQQAPAITATPSVAVKAGWPASVKASRKYAVSAPHGKAQIALVKAALAPVSKAAGGCLVGYSAVIAGQQWHYCKRTGTYSAKACGVLPAVTALTAAQVRRNYSAAMAAKILAI